MDRRTGWFLYTPPKKQPCLWEV